MLFSIIVPVFNEEETILEVLKRLNDQKILEYEFEIIIIDDCSTDGTKKLLENNKKRYDHLILLEKNLGKGGAVREGLKRATGKYILFQDGDLEYHPKEFSKIFSTSIEFNADIVIGSRFLAPEYTRVHYFFHKVGNSFITFVFNLLYNTTFSDIYSCYLCFKRELIVPEKLKTNGWQQQAEILATIVKKSKIHFEVPISYSGRTYADGKKIRAKDTISVVYTIFKKRLF